MLCGRSLGLSWKLGGTKSEGRRSNRLRVTRATNQLSIQEISSKKHPEKPSHHKHRLSYLESTVRPTKTLLGMVQVSLLIFCCLSALVLYSSPVSGFSSPPITTKASRSCKSRWCPTPRTRTSRVPTTLSYGEKLGVDPQLVFDTWEWTANLGAPGEY